MFLFQIKGNDVIISTYNTKILDPVDVLHVQRNIVIDTESIREYYVVKLICVM